MGKCKSSFFFVHSISPGNTSFDVSFRQKNTLGYVQPLEYGENSYIIDTLNLEYATKTPALLNRSILLIAGQYVALKLRLDYDWTNAKSYVIKPKIYEKLSKYFILLKITPFQMWRLGVQSKIIKDSSARVSLQMPGEFWKIFFE